MKKIFTLMLALACAMFAGVSCTPDNGGDGDAYASTVTVTGAPEANLAPEAGELTLGYTITNPSLTAALAVTTEATWVHVGEVGETSVVLTYDANTDSPGSPAREAVVVFTYEGAKTVEVVVKQDSAAPQFAVEFLEVSCGSAQYVCTPVDNEMLYLLASTQELGQYGVQGETPAEKMQAYLDMLAMYGMISGEADGWYVFKGATTEMPKEATRYSAEESVEVYALGFSVEVTGTDEWGSPIVNVTPATATHAWEVPFLPYPSLTVAEADLVKNVTAAAGSVTVDCVLENPVEGTEVVCQTEAAWVVPTWADNKLTLTYEANDAAVARRAKVVIQYGWLTNPFEVTLVQEKNADAVAVTLNVEVTSTQFDGIWVNVTPSDPNALYALSYKAVDTDWETGAELETDWMTEAENLLSYVSSTVSFHKGNVTGHFIKLNPSNYEWYGYDYNVWAVVVNATSEETTDYYGNPKTNWTVSQILSEVYHTKTTVDASKMPSLEWDLTKNPELVWNENSDRYDLTVEEGAEVVLHFIVNNPAPGAFLALNGTTLYDSNNVVDGEPVIDNEAGTITLKVDKFDAAKYYHYINLTFKYTNADNDTWGITTPTVRLTQTQKAE